MHELSICQALIDQIENLAKAHEARTVERIVLRIGPLSGVEPPLLEQAYPLAAAGSVAEKAELVIEPTAVRVRCRQCGAETEATLSRLVCGQCGDYRTCLVSGDEMVLARLEFLTDNQ